MTPVRPTPPKAVRWIARKLEAAGYETWAVGGAIRDALRGHPSDDWDLATRAHPRDVRRIFRRTIPIGVEHGTVGVLSDDGVMYEVTTFRRDVETDGRHAVVSFAETVDEDLGRRDFTMNALAWHPLREEFRDPFDGIGDLERGVLRAVGVASERFAEDHLRILRAFRFAGRFDLTVEDATWVAACAAVERLPTLSAERIREELLKVLGADPAPSTALTLYLRSGALKVLYPELEVVASSAPEGWDELLRVVDHLPRERPLLRLAALLRGLPPRDAAQLLSRMKLSNVQVNEVAHRGAAPPLPPPTASDADVRRWLAKVGPERVPALARLDLALARTGGPVPPEDVVAAWRQCRAVLAQGPPLTVADLAVDGRDLIGVGLRPGPRFGSLLDRLLEWVLEDPARNEPELLLDRARELAKDDAAGG